MTTCTPKRNGLRQVSPKKAAREAELAQTKKRLQDERGTGCQALDAFRGKAVLLRADDFWAVEEARSACTGRGTDLHHVLQRSLGGGDEDENLLLLCRPDHIFVHDNPALATKLGLLRSSWDQVSSVPVSTGDGGNGTTTEHLSAIRSGSPAPTSLVRALRDELERQDPQTAASSLKAEALANVAWRWIGAPA